MLKMHQLAANDGFYKIGVHACMSRGLQELPEESINAILEDLMIMRSVKLISKV